MTALPFRLLYQELVQVGGEAVCATLNRKGCKNLIKRQSKQKCPLVSKQELLPAFGLFLVYFSGYFFV